MALLLLGEHVMDQLQWGSAPDPASRDKGEPVVHCEPAEHADAGDGQEIDAPVQDERTLEEAGYGHGV
jgi:hypothetical protein